MIPFFSRANTWMRQFGIDVKQFFNASRSLLWYRRCLRAYRQSLRDESDRFPITRLNPQLLDRLDSGGTASGHYFHQDLLVARRLYANNPQNHIDVGSRVDGFVAHVASFRPITVLDVRPTQSKVINITFRQANIMAEVDPDLEASCDSISCLHSIEHFGLGRYGDPIDANGHVLGFQGLCRLLQEGGTMYLSTVIGPQRTEFNAHRVFSLRYLLDLVAAACEVAAFSYVDDQGVLHENAPLIDTDIHNNYGCHFGCAILELRKR